MIKNHFKIAYRNLVKQKGLALINILSLSAGLACCSLIILYAINEFSFDRFHDDTDRIFRVYRWTEARSDRDATADAYLPMPFGPAMKADFLDVETVVRVRDAWGENLVRVDNKISKLGVNFADAQFFDLFNFPLKYGDPASALQDVQQLVLTEKTALQLFGESNPVGRTLEIKIEEEFEPFTVSAVAADLPANSSITFDILATFEKWASSKYGEGRRENWNQSAYMTYVKLRQGSGLATDSDRLLGFRRKYYPDHETQLRERGYWTADGAPVTYKMQPLTAMHTNTQISGGEVAAVEPDRIWMLLYIAAGILLIAIINFTTLAIGRSASRAKEVGVRKVIGSSRGQLVGQFMTEAILLTACSGIFGFLLAQALLPYFNELAERALTFSFQLYPQIGWMLLAVVLLTGLLAGSYPAMVLSRFRPIEVFKNKVKLSGSNLFTKALVTTQFILSIGLVISTIVILKQLEFMQTKHPGFNKEQVLVINAEGMDVETIYPRLRTALQEDPRFKGIAASELGLGAGTGWGTTGFRYKGESKEIFEYFVDDDYLSVLDIELLSGRNFSAERADRANRSVIINEAMVKDFGWTKEEAIGQELTSYFGEGTEPKVIGVVKDFHFRPFREAVKPQLFHQYEDYTAFNFFVRIEPGDPAAAIAALQQTWASIVPEYPLDYTFLDENLNRFYRAEAQISSILGWAGGISVFLACLGLFGLAALAAANRNKEIGIRKVLGASVSGIIGLLSKDFMKLVLVALLIGAPIAWYVMSQWLENFAYRIDIEWWMFIIAGLLAVAVAFLTVSFQCARAAMTNPVEALRRE